jgi:hypothetical protein
MIFSPKILVSTVQVIYHHVRERVACGQVIFLQVPSSENVADIFTKPLSHELFSVGLESYAGKHQVMHFVTVIYLILLLNSSTP